MRKGWARKNRTSTGKMLMLLRTFIVMVFILYMLMDGKESMGMKEISKEFSYIEITDKSNGSIMRLDNRQSKDLYENWQSFTFDKGTKKKGISEDEGKYDIRFLGEFGESGRFTILSENEIVFGSHRYQLKDRKFNISSLTEYFYTIFKGEIIESGDQLLIAADEASGVYRSSDRIYASLGSAQIVDHKENTLGKEQLKRGDIVEIAFDGIIAESYPAQITASRVKVIDRDILLDGYMALIEDVYKEDSGLNSEISVIAFDTSEWIELSEIRKEILFSMIREKYEYEIIEGSYDELVTAGMINERELYFKDGILIELKEMIYDPTKQVLEASVSKWRSGLGAIGWSVKAKLESRGWKITRTNEWIS